MTFAEHLREFSYQITKYAREYDGPKDEIPSEFSLEFSCRCYMTFSNVMRKDMIKHRYRTTEYEKILQRIDWLKPGKSADYDTLERWINKAITHGLVDKTEIDAIGKRSRNEDDDKKEKEEIEQPRKKSKSVPREIYITRSEPRQSTITNTTYTTAASTLASFDGDCDMGMD
jgi:hypothetical protein